MIKLYPHQEAALNKLSNGKILWGGVGSGKSITAVAYYERNEKPRDIYVITTAKKRNSLDWEGEFSRIGVGKAKDATTAGVLTVDSWNNIGKYIGVKDAFFIFDEQRLVGAGAWVKAFYKIAGVNRWIMLSATPGDTWLDYIPVFVANGFYKNRTEFKLEHVVYSHRTKFPKVERYIGTGRLLRHRKEILVEMPYKRHTTRHIITETCEYDKELFEKVWMKRWHVYEERPLRDLAEMFSVARKVVNSDASRSERLVELLRQHPKVIVFYSFDYELEILRKMLKELSAEKPQSTGYEPNTGYRAFPDDETSMKNEEVLAEWMRRVRKTTAKGESSAFSELTSQQSFDSTDFSTKNFTTSTGTNSDGLRSHQSMPSGGFAVAEWNGNKHQEIPKTDRWVYLVQYTAGAEGWNCIETNVIVFWSLQYSYRLFEQAQGRIDRLNTPFDDLYYYVFRSQSMVDRAIWGALLKKKTFNVVDFIKKRGFEG